MLKAISERTNNQFTKNEINGLATIVKGLLTTVANQFTKNKIN